MSLVFHCCPISVSVTPFRLVIVILVTPPLSLLSSCCYRHPAHCHRRRSDCRSPPIYFHYIRPFTIPLGREAANPFHCRPLPALEGYKYRGPHPPLLLFFLYSNKRASKQSPPGLDGLGWRSWLAGWLGIYLPSRVICILLFYIPYILLYTFSC